MLALGCAGLVAGEAWASGTAAGFADADEALAFARAVLGEVDDDGGGDASVGSDVEEAAGAALRFGGAGTTWWSVRGGVAVAADATDWNARWTVHHFVAEDFEFNAALMGWYHDQDGDNEVSAGAEIGFRWHFVNRGVEEVGPGGIPWSVYGQVGIGLMGSSGDVPEDGTSYNFTPHGALGVTFRPWESATRVDVGVAWHHISNGSSSGSDDNPARDGVHVYAGLVFPF